MKKINRNFLINNIAKETQILESLDWDEEKLQHLYSYLDLHFTGDSIISPKILLKEIYNEYGKECAKILQAMFVEVSLSHGLFIHDPEIEN